MAHLKRCSVFWLVCALLAWLAFAPALRASDAASPVDESSSQAIATDDFDEHPFREPPSEWERRYGEDGAGPRVSFGAAAIEGLETGLYVRLETEYFVQEARGERRRIGPLTGVLVGVDGWANDDGGGMGLPTTMYLGLRYPLFGRAGPIDLFSTVGLGWHWVIWDAADADGGFGILAPLSLADFGLDLGGIRLLGEAAAQYRWQWGAPDRYQLRLGGVLSLHSELWDG